MRNEREALLFFNIIRFSPKRILEFIESGQISRFINITEKKVYTLNFLSIKEIEEIIISLSNFKIEEELEKLDELNIKYCTILDEIYPENLRNIYDPPFVLYYRGEGIENLSNTIGIVGSRKPTEYGIFCLKNIISGLKKFNIKIVSGMALGIDYYAHKFSIDNKIPTIGILASSLEYEYPTSNKVLYERMKDHLLISEFPLGTPPIKRNFVIRNRIISGVSLGILVVEAAERSGSLITANFALEQNKELFAVPGNITSIYSKGCNKLIKDGANLVEDANDIISNFPFILEKNRLNTSEIYNFDENEIKIIDLLSKGLYDIDEIVYITKLDISEVYPILIRLELNNEILRIENKFTI